MGPTGLKLALDVGGDWVCPMSRPDLSRSVSFGPSGPRACQNTASFGRFGAYFERCRGPTGPTGLKFALKVGGDWVCKMSTPDLTRSVSFGPSGPRACQNTASFGRFGAYFERCRGPMGPTGLKFALKVGGDWVCPMSRPDLSRSVSFGPSGPRACQNTASFGRFGAYFERCRGPTGPTGLKFALKVGGDWVCKMSTPDLTRSVSFGPSGPRACQNTASFGRFGAYFERCRGPTGPTGLKVALKVGRDWVCTMSTPDESRSVSSWPIGPREKPKIVQTRRRSGVSERISNVAAVLWDRRVSNLH